MANKQAVKKTIIPVADLEKPSSSPGRSIDLKSDKALKIMSSLIEDYKHKYGKAPKFVLETYNQMIKEKEKD